MAAENINMMILLFIPLMFVAIASADDLCTVEKGPYGAAPNHTDNTTQQFSGELEISIISAFRVVTIQNTGETFMKCLSFIYNIEGTHACPDAEEGSLETVQDIKLFNDEYITEVQLTYNGVYIKKIQFKSNRRTLGPYGPASTVLDTIITNGEKKPLLFATGSLGLWLYEIKFFFSCLEADNLKDKANQIAKESFSALKSNLEDLFIINDKYKRMLPSIAAKGCFPYTQSLVQEAKPSCDLAVLLTQINIFVSRGKSYEDHLPRSLIKIADYDSSGLLDEADEAKNFHNLFTNIQFSLSDIAQIQTETAEKLANYFNKTAQFDKSSGNTTLVRISNYLTSLKSGSNEVTDDIKRRLPRVFGFAVGLSTIVLTDRYARLALVMAENINPLVIFGGPKFSQVLAATQQVSEAQRQFGNAVALLARMSTYLDHMMSMQPKFAQNAEQHTAMNDIVDRFDTVTDEEKFGLAIDLVRKYGEYKAGISKQDIVYAVELLGKVISEGCGIIAKSSSTVVNIAGMVYETVAQDCTYLPVSVKQLRSYMDETYSAQFRLIDSMKVIARAQIAIASANELATISTEIDVRKTTIGSVMVETNYQNMAHERCNIIEFENGGKRPDICKHLFFTDHLIPSIINYQGTTNKSESTTWAYIPTTNNSREEPYIDLDSLVAGNMTYFTLPTDNIPWLIKYKWLPEEYTNAQYNKETSYSIKRFEVFIPGLKCANTSSEYSITVDAVSGIPQKLFNQSAPPMYLLPSILYRFKYTEQQETCAIAKMPYSIKEDNSSLSSKPGQLLCVASEGVPTGELTLRPSIFAGWYIHVKHACNLTLDIDFQPLITVRITKEEVMPTGIDECWPQGSRCDEGKICHDALLSYSCDGQKRRSLWSNKK